MVLTQGGNDRQLSPIEIDSSPWLNPDEAIRAKLQADRQADSAQQQQALPLQFYVQYQVNGGLNTTVVTQEAIRAGNVKIGGTVYPLAGTAYEAAKVTLASGTPQEQQQIATQSKDVYETWATGVMEQLHAKREALKSEFAGEFTPYTQYVATREVGEPVATKQQFAQIQYLKSPTAQWASESVFAEKVAQVDPYAPSGTVFRGQIVQPAYDPTHGGRGSLAISPPSLTAFSPQVYSPFGRGIIRKENFLGAAGQAAFALPLLSAMPQPVFKPYESPLKKYTSYPIYSRASALSTGLQTGFESLIGYSEESSHPIKRIASGAASMITGLPAYYATSLMGAEYTFRNPQRYPKMAPMLATIPGGALAPAVPGALKTGAQIIQQAREKPFETVGMFAGMVAFGKALKSPIKGGNVEVPTIKGTSSVWKGAYAQISSRVQPIIGVGKSVKNMFIRTGGILENVAPEYRIMADIPAAEIGINVPKPNIIIGTPKASQMPGIELKGEYIPKTPLETKIMARPEIMERFGYSATEAEKVRIGGALMSMTQTQKSRFLEKSFIQESKTLSPLGVGEVLKYAKEQPELVEQLYGSFSARPQMMPEYRRVPGDIDIQLSTGSQTVAEAFTKGLETRLKAIGEKVQISKEKPTLIESITPKGTHHALDIHFKGEPTTDVLTPSYEGAYGFKFGQKSIKIESIKTMPLSEHGLRKGASSLTWQPGGKVLPAAHRMKDIADFYTTQKTLIESRLLGFGKQKATAMLERWKELYPEVDWNKQLSSNIKMPILQQKTGSKGILSASTGMALYGIGKPRRYKTTDEQQPMPSVSLRSPASLKGLIPSYGLASPSASRSYSPTSKATSPYSKPSYPSPGRYSSPFGYKSPYTSIIPSVSYPSIPTSTARAAPYAKAPRSPSPFSPSMNKTYSGSSLLKFRPSKFKLTSPLGKKGKIRPPGYGKFTIIARVASTKQVMKGFGLFGTTKRTVRKGKGKRR